MSIRYYANGPAHSLAAAVSDSSTTTIVVDSVSGWPTQFPYTIIIDKDGVLEELCDVTNAVGTTLTVVRGADSSLASAHAAGVSVVHGVSARDFREANVHVNATENVHGRTGDLVDTDTFQTIVGSKTFVGGLSTTGGDVVDDGSDQTIGGNKTFSNAPVVTGKGAVATTAGDQTLSGDQTFTGTENHQGTETHSGTETHTGTEVHTGEVEFSGGVECTDSVMRWVNASNSTDETSTLTTPSPGGTPVGVSFVAPPSGRGFVTITGYFEQAINGQDSILGWRMGLGAELGSGGEVVPAHGDRALVCGKAVVSSGPAQLGASRRSPVTGLTPGQTYNIEAQFWTSSGGRVNVFFREIVWEPSLN